MLVTNAPSVVVMVPKSAARSLIWCISDLGEIFNVTSSGTVTDAALPQDWIGRRIDVGPQGQVWVLASHRHTDEFSLHLRATQTHGWRRVCGLPELTEMAAGEGGVWLSTAERLQLVDERGGVKRSHHLPCERPQNVCESPDGALWVVGGNARHGGWALHRLGSHAKHWSEFPAPIAAVQLSCASDGTAWTINSKGQVWRIHPEGPGHFKECTEHAECRGCLKSPSAESIEEISVGPDGQIWCRTRKLMQGGTQIVRLLPQSTRVVQLPVAIGAMRIAAGVKVGT